jgi:hypothetical protein
MQHWKYIAERIELTGKYALVRPGETDDEIMVQFDDIGTGLGHGWHPFPKADFEKMEDLKQE